MPEEVERLYNCRPKEQKESRLESKQCISLINWLTQGARKVFVVFDALDECAELDDQSHAVGAKMIKAISTISNFASVFVTSRPHVDLSLAMKDCLSLEIFAHDSDMLFHLQDWVRDYLRLRKILDPESELERYIGDTICMKAHGI